MMEKLGDLDLPRSAALAQAMADFASLFRAEFGLDVYLTWGTLLGAIREGDFIAHDVDVDLAYLSAKSNDFEILEEHELIVRVLDARGLRVRPHSRGQMHVDMSAAAGSAQGQAFDLDLWTSWTRDGRYFHYPDIKGELAAPQVAPLRRHTFRGHAVLVPACAEAVLAQFYGSQWRVPDAAYAWYPRYDSTDVFEFLRTERRPVTLPERPRRAQDIDIVERDGYFFLDSTHLHETQRLNATAMLILELCDGTRTPAAIIALIERSFALPSAPEVAVLEFLNYAAGCGLLEAD